MTRRETFESIADIWMREVDMYSTVDNAVKMVVANKVDKVLFHISASALLRLWESHSGAPVRVAASAQLLLLPGMRMRPLSLYSSMGGRTP